VPPGTAVLMLDAAELVAIDETGLDALLQLQRDLARRGTRLQLAGLHPQPLAAIRRAGAETLLGDDAPAVVPG